MSHDSAPHAATICCISTSIGCGGISRRSNSPRSHLPNQRRLLQQIIARGCEQPPFGYRAAPMPCASDALHGDRDGPRAGDLAHQIDIADIDAELERGCRHQDLDLASLQAPFRIQAQGSRERSMVCRHILNAKPLSKGEGHPLHKPSCVHEDQR